jgi:hypothetical protein
MAIAVSEKRKHPRIDKKILLKIAQRWNEQVPDWTMVTSKNISAGGVLFGCGAAMRRGESLYLTMYFPGHTIHCTGVVQRTAPGPHAPLQNIAVSFRGLEKEDLELIDAYAA